MAEFASNPGSTMKAELRRFAQCEKARRTLFDAIAHGNETHREWLREAIDAHFAGLPIPAPRQ